ncbi:hypothetical protein DVH24_005614 [Malus domestica]|uniref:Uncharacterized protein n=1 Tax=Malus domestica TaxID=3750 RepID=A0A498IPG3_MALDO|nr:hypothetical protein DVH24_005614 [Malus domestica]
MNIGLSTNSLSTLPGIPKCSAITSRRCLIRDITGSSPKRRILLKGMTGVMWITINSLTRKISNELRSQPLISTAFMDSRSI